MQLQKSIGRWYRRYFGMTSGHTKYAAASGLSGSASHLPHLRMLTRLPKRVSQRLL